MVRIMLWHQFLSPMKAARESHTMNLSFQCPFNLKFQVIFLCQRCITTKKVFPAREGFGNDVPTLIAYVLFLQSNLFNAPQTRLLVRLNYWISSHSEMSFPSSVERIKTISNQLRCLIIYCFWCAWSMRTGTFDIWFYKTLVILSIILLGMKRKEYHVSSEFSIHRFVIHDKS